MMGRLMRLLAKIFVYIVAVSIASNLLSNRYGLTPFSAALSIAASLLLLYIFVTDRLSLSSIAKAIAVLIFLLYPAETAFMALALLTLYVAGWNRHILQSMRLLLKGFWRRLKRVFYE